MFLKKRSEDVNVLMRQASPPALGFRSQVLLKAVDTLNPCPPFHLEIVKRVCRVGSCFPQNWLLASFCRDTRASQSSVVKIHKVFIT